MDYIYRELNFLIVSILDKYKNRVYRILLLRLNVTLSEAVHFRLLLPLVFAFTIYPVQILFLGFQNFKFNSFLT